MGKVSHKWRNATFLPNNPTSNVLAYTQLHFTAIAGAEIGMKAGYKMAIVNELNLQTYYVSTGSLWTITPLTLGYPG